MIGQTQGEYRLRILALRILALSCWKKHSLSFSSPDPIEPPPEHFEKRLSTGIRRLSLSNKNLPIRRLRLNQKQIKVSLLRSRPTSRSAGHSGRGFSISLRFESALKKH